MRRRAAVSIHARLERVRVVRCGMAQHRYEYPDTVKEVTHPHDTRPAFIKRCSMFGNSCQVSEVSAPTFGRLYGNAATGAEQAKMWACTCASGECSFVQRCAEE